MSSAEVRRRFVFRKIIAVALLCLFAFRGLGFLGMTAPLAAAARGRGPQFQRSWPAASIADGGTK